MLRKIWNAMLRHPRRTLLIIALLALAARLVAGTLFYNAFDLKRYNIPWALGMRNGLFSCYSTIQNLDYPPLFPSLLSLVAPLVSWGEQHGVWQVTMLGIKLIPILFDVGTLLVLYFGVESISKKRAIGVALLWAVNPVTFFNCAFWGQADSILLFFAALTFVLFQKKKPEAATLCFALGCLAKLQMVYFAPVVLCELFFRYRAKRAFRSVCGGAAAGLLAWAPFMLGSRELTLPFRIYFGGFQKYPTVNMYAYNAYGFPKLLNTNVNEKVFPGLGLTYAQLSMVVTALLFVFVIASYWYARKKKKAVPAAMIAMLYINGIFMLTAKQHERYQIPVLILAVVCWMYLERDKRLRIPLLGMLVLPFANEAVGLFHMRLGKWFHNTIFLPALSVGSLLNVLLFCYMLYLFITILRGPKRPAARVTAPEETKIPVKL